MKGFVMTAGDVVEFLYPRHNYAHAPLRWVARRVRVKEIRDITEQPLDPITPVLNPHLRRSAVLLVGEDVTIGQERSFYVGSMVNVRRIDGNDV